MLRMQVKLIGGKELAEKLDRLGVSLYDLSEEMVLVGELLAKFFANEVFASRGGILGKTWAALADSTRAYKAAHWAGAPDLVRTGDLKDGYGYSAGMLSVMVDNKVQVGEYNLATIMQDGSPKNNLPPRSVIGLTEPLRIQVVEIITAGVDKKIAGV